MVQGKIALITGGSRGIGASTAEILAQKGATVIINYSKDAQGAQAVADGITAKGGNAHTIQAPVQDKEAVGRMFEQIKKDHGRLDILVNNAGVTADRTLKNMNQDEWDKVININLNSLYYVTKQALPLMGEGGRIVNVSSIVGIYGNLGQTNYAAAKAGMIGFTKSLSKELGKKGITVNAVAPGFIETAMTKDLPFIKKKLLSILITLRRTGQPEEIGHSIAFLASPEASYITGEVLSVNGGLNF